MCSIQFEARRDHVRRFYSILEELKAAVGGKRTLDRANGRMSWPLRGVYFFFERGEERTTSGTGLRVVRVGTHAMKVGAKATLWTRLRQHRGQLRGEKPGGGNHRGSVFRLHVGTALIGNGCWADEVTAHWGERSSASRSIRDAELPLERAVSRHIRRMPLLWLAVFDEPGPESMRGYIERNAIALVSNYGRSNMPIDRASPAWLGKWADNEKVRRSGLWNANHVADRYDPDFLNILRQYVSAM